MQFLLVNPDHLMWLFSAAVLGPAHFSNRAHQVATGTIQTPTTQIQVGCITRNPGSRCTDCGREPDHPFVGSPAWMAYRA